MKKKLIDQMHGAEAEKGSKLFGQSGEGRLIYFGKVLTRHKILLLTYLITKKLTYLFS